MTAWDTECAEAIPLLLCFYVLKTIDQSRSQMPAYPWAGWEKFSIVARLGLEGTLQKKQEHIIPLTEILMKPCLKFFMWTFFISLANCHLSKTMSSKGQQDLSVGKGAGHISLVTWVWSLEPHKCGRREPIPLSCLLASTSSLCHVWVPKHTNDDHDDDDK